MIRSCPSSMNACRGWRVGSKSRSSAPFMTTVIFSGATPRATASARSGSWTVSSSSAIAEEPRATPRTIGRRSPPEIPAKRSSKKAGISSCRSSRSGTPASFRGPTAKTRKSGRVATCTKRYRRRRCSAVSRAATWPAKARYSARCPANPLNWRRTGSRMTRKAPSTSTGSCPASRRANTSTA